MGPSKRDRCPVHARVRLRPAGQGWSDDSPNPADATHAATDLHRLLAAAGEPGPYVLAGHSLGGIHALTYAHLYRNEVAGVVLLDSSSPHQAEVMKSFNGQYRLWRRVLAAMPTLARLGVGRVMEKLSAPALPGRPGRQASAFATSPRGWANQRAEQATLPTAFAQAQALTGLGDIPLVVLTSATSDEQTPGWKTGQDELAALSSNTRHTVADVGHMDFLLDRAGAAISVTGIDDVLTAVRTGTALATNPVDATTPSPHPDRRATTRHFGRGEDPSNPPDRVHA